MRSFLYLHAVDLSAARDFYSGLIGLEEIAASEDVVGYMVGELQITIAQHDDAGGTTGPWASQLGWRGGTTASASWGFEVADDAFVGVVSRLQSASSRCWADEPAWVGYWSYPVTDPMGNTVEISASSNDAWATSAS